MKANLKVITVLLSLFILSQLAGIIILDRNIDVLQSKEKGETVFKDIYIAGMELEKPDINQSWSFAYIITAVIIGTLLIFGIVRLKLLFLWRVWFFLAASLCLTLALSAFIPGSLALIFGISFALLKIFRPGILVHNLTEPLIYSGIAVIFVPLINLFSMIILLLLISVYDAYAVWKSKHMIKLAKLQTEAKLFSGMLIPYQFKKLKQARKMPSKLLRKGKGIKVAVLGGGDIAFPLLFTGVILKTYGLWQALLIIPFTALALFLLFYKGKKNRFYPAMPFLTAGCIAGFIAVLILSLI